MRALLLVACLAACGDNLKAKDDAGVSDAAPDAQALRHCLDRPTEIVRPPNGQLPCDLLPPGFGQ
ncbi:MAG TPA: hypothetical protein VFV99_16810 [Kofleriaceae bacterium]|nr:hypothetical protein [Kofleriaceae bacterium]